MEIGELREVFGEGNSGVVTRTGLIREVEESVELTSPYGAQWESGFLCLCLAFQAQLCI